MGEQKPQEGVVYSTDTPDYTLQPEKWQTMELSDLYDQRIVLMNRITIAHNVGNHSIYTQLNKWLHYLDQTIDNYHDEV